MKRQPTKSRKRFEQFRSDATCSITGKVIFTNQDSAEKAARRATYRLKTEGERVNAYICPHCNEWHIGHTDRRR